MNDGTVSDSKFVDAAKDAYMLFLEPLNDPTREYIALMREIHEADKDLQRKQTIEGVERQCDARQAEVPPPQLEQPMPPNNKAMCLSNVFSSTL